MKHGTPASKRDWTGLACTAGMGLLVLLAWATLPRLPARDGARADSATKPGSAFATPLVDARSPDLPPPAASLADPGTGTRS